MVDRSEVGFAAEPGERISADLFFSDLSFSPAMRQLHDRLTALLQEKTDMQIYLRERYSTSSRAAQTARMSIDF